MKKKTKEKPNNVVLTIKNAENYIEGLILMYLRIIRSRELTQKFHITDLYIIDKGSTDSTPIILEKLTKQYPFIHLVTVSPHKNQTIK